MFGWSSTRRSHSLADASRPAPPSMRSSVLYA
jgi:hypothetical protein